MPVAPGAGVTDFLFRHTDPRLELVRREVRATGKTVPKDAGWEFSKDRHEEARRKEKLGSCRPGDLKLDEHLWPEYLAKQPNRVRVFIDMSYLLCAC